jgi:hypothetical protein
LERVLASGTGRCARSDRFVQAFVRPGGLDRPVLPVVLDKIEALRGLGKSPGEARTEPPVTEDRIYRALRFLRWSFRPVEGTRLRRRKRREAQAGARDGEATPSSDLMPAE